MVSMDRDIDYSFGVAGSADIEYLVCLAGTSIDFDEEFSLGFRLAKLSNLKVP